MAKERPAAFALLPDSIPLVQSYWTLVVKLGENYSQLGEDGDSDGKTLMEKVGLRALLLIRACSKMAFNPAQTFKYQTPQDKEEKQRSIEQIKSDLFTHEFVVSVMELLVTQFFRFRKADFQEWEAEPEEWERKEEDIAEAWEFSIRSCSEKLFLDLVIHFKDLLIPRLLNVFYSFASKFKSPRRIFTNTIDRFPSRSREARRTAQRLVILRHRTGFRKLRAAIGLQQFSGDNACPRSSNPGAGLQCP
jgi:hypothetical protein